MDFISLYYFLELSKDLNMTKTAKRLYISQQTLSNHIKRLEKYYNAQLFFRKPELILTNAGEYVLEFAKELEKKHTNLKDILSDIEGQERGILRIGASSARGVQFLPRILFKFSKRYPNVKIRFSDMLSDESEKMILNGELDFSIVLSNESTLKFNRHSILNDQIYLCVPDSLLRKYHSLKETNEIKARSISGANIEDFTDLPFAVLTNRLGSQIGESFVKAKVKPNIYFVGTYTNQTLPLCNQGLCVCYCTHLGLIESYDKLSPDVNVFPLFTSGKPMFQELSIIYNKDRYLTRYAKYFLDILLETAREMKEFKISRVAK